jgi:hypothetical protein
MESEFTDAVLQAAAVTLTLVGVALLSAGAMGLIAGSFGVGQIAAEQMGLVLVGVALFGFGRLVPRGE